MTRIVVLATWDLDGYDEAAIAEIRAAMASLGAAIQVLHFEDDALVSVDPPPPAAEVDPAHARLTALLRQVPARPNMSPGWKDRTLAAIDEARVLEAADAVLCNDFAFESYRRGDGPIRQHDLERWSFAIAERLRALHDVPSPTAEVYPVGGRRVAVRAIGVEVIYPMVAP